MLGNHRVSTNTILAALSIHHPTSVDYQSYSHVSMSHALLEEPHFHTSPLRIRNGTMFDVPCRETEVGISQNSYYNLSPGEAGGFNAE